MIYIVKEMLLGSRRKCEREGCSAPIVFVLENLAGTREFKLCTTHGSNVMQGIEEMS